MRPDFPLPLTSLETSGKHLHVIRITASYNTIVLAHFNKSKWNIGSYHLRFSLNVKIAIHDTLHNVVHCLPGHPVYRATTARLR